MLVAELWFIRGQRMRFCLDDRIRNLLLPPFFREEAPGKPMQLRSFPSCQGFHPLNSELYRKANGFSERRSSTVLSSIQDLILGLVHVAYAQGHIHCDIYLLLARRDRAEQRSGTSSPGSLVLHHVGRLSRLDYGSPPPPPPLFSLSPQSLLRTV